MRKYFYDSKEIEKGKTNIWIVADREFSDKEARAKLVEVVDSLLPTCKAIAISINKEAHVELLPKKTAIVREFKVAEIVVPKKCARKVVYYAKKNWKGKWKRL